MEKIPSNGKAGQVLPPSASTPSITDHLSPHKVLASDLAKKICSKEGQNELPDAPDCSKSGHDTPIEVSSKQLVPYGGSDDPGLASLHASDCAPYDPFSKVLPSVGAFTVQCAICLKWRIIPKQEKYEEIRANISEVPFLCATAKEWCREISCDDPSDLTPDGSRIWAMDKPNIAQTPKGWQRLLRIRGEGCSRFADVYYISPSGKKLRSMVEIQRHLNDRPAYAQEGVNISQFSFQIPKPMQENYTKKRAAVSTGSRNENDLSITRRMEPIEVNPLSWADPMQSRGFQIGEQHAKKMKSSDQASLDAN